MTDQPRPIHPDPPTLESIVARLDEKITTLEAATKSELRTRRLVVTDDQDRPRLVTEIGRCAELRLEVPSERGQRTAAVLYACPATDDEQPGVGFALQADGNAEVDLGIARHASGSWWLPNIHFQTRETNDA